MNRILIVDDEPAICWSLKEGLTDLGHVVEVASSIERAERSFQFDAPELIVLDVRLPGQDGLSAIPRFRERWPDAHILVMTAFGDLQTVVDAMKRGAFEYLVKPFELSQFLAVVNRALSTPRPSFVDNPHLVGSNQLVGRGPAMQAVFKQIALVALTDFPVLITGETGTGKELVAEAIHQHSPRRDKPFIRVSLASLSPSVIESELFGHVKGAFTGATEDRAGLFELAENGTIFLDEIGETPLNIQVKLLRVLESRKLSKVGSGHELNTNVRLIAATNRNLKAMVAETTFREDLYHRLNVFSITLPSLVERREDIRPLVEFFLAKQTIPVNPPISDEVWAFLEHHAWPGNIRELSNAIDHAVVLARGGPLAIEHFPAEVSSSQQSHVQSSESLTAAIATWVQEQLGKDQSEPPTNLYRQFLADAESALFEEILKHTEQNRTTAARLLGLDRATLRSKISATQQ